jgi:hypothetical protein
VTKGSFSTGANRHYFYFFSGRRHEDSSAQSFKGGLRGRLVCYVRGDECAYIYIYDRLPFYCVIRQKLLSVHSSGGRYLSYMCARQIKASSI